MRQAADLFTRSAELLSGKRDQAQAGADARALLASLEYLEGDPALTAGRVRLLEAAARLKRLFRLQSPDAPGLVFLGGEADPAALGLEPAGPGAISLSGNGVTLRRAFESCVGEGVEYVSQFLGPDLRPERAPAVARLDGAGSRTRAFFAAAARDEGGAPIETLDWIAARHLLDGRGCWVPADLCLRRAREKQDFAAPFKLSTGCAAGPSWEAAALHALLELIERDATALWWRGGRRGRALEIADCAGAAELLARLRQGADGRRTWLLDITSDLDVPAVAAISCRGDGKGVACGFAARPSLAAAAQSAILELCQMELAYAVVRAKRQERGDAGLNDADRLHLRRETLIDAASCAWLHPAAAQRPVAADIAGGPAQALAEIGQRLSARGFEVLAIDLTRAFFDVPVVRVMVPGLQLDPSPLIGERLAQAIAETGGGPGYTASIALL